MRRLFEWVLAGAVVVAMTSAACAEEMAAPPGVEVKKPEAKQAAKSVFHKADANKNGKLTALEQKADLKQWFKKLDANKDEKVSAEEFAGMAMAEIDSRAIKIEEKLLFVGNEAERVTWRHDGQYALHERPSRTHGIDTRRDRPRERDGERPEHERPREQPAPPGSAVGKDDRAGSAVAHPGRPMAGGGPDHHVGQRHSP